MQEESKYRQCISRSIKLTIYWTQGEKFSTKTKTTKFTQMCISSVLTPHKDQRHLAPVLHPYFSAHAYPCGHENISQCLLLGRVFLQPIGKLPWLSPSFQMPIIISSNPSSILSILGHDDEQPSWNWFHLLEHFTLQLASP
jgi:hypothetical protein